MITEIHHEKYHDEFSMAVAVACDVSHTCAAASFFDMRLDRLIARSVIPIAELTEENAAAEVSRLIFMSMRQHGIPAAAVSGIGIAAPHDLSDAIEENIDPADMFLRPDTEMIVLPFVSMYADGRFAAMLSAITLKKGTFAASFGRMLDLAYHDGEKLRIASVALSGAFDGSAIESGMAVEYGAIDEVRRETDGMLCYCVVGDIDACGIAVPAVLDAISVMVGEGIIDNDGIMTDRDQFYIGEDYCLTQKDIRAVQSDKARAAAAIRCFLKKCDAVSEVWLGGDALAGQGLKQLEALGVIGADIAQKAQCCRSYTEYGIYRCIVNHDHYAKLKDNIRLAEDISYDIYEDFDDLYITNLQF